MWGEECSALSSRHLRWSGDSTVYYAYIISMPQATEGDQYAMTVVRVLRYPSKENELDES